jgi:hypothetical protein
MAGPEKHRGEGRRAGRGDVPVGLLVTFIIVLGDVRVVEPAARPSTWTSTPRPTLKVGAPVKVAGRARRQGDRGIDYRGGEVDPAT